LAHRGEAANVVDEREEAEGLSGVLAPEEVREAVATHADEGAVFVLAEDEGVLAGPAGVAVVAGGLAIAEVVGDLNVQAVGGLGDDVASDGAMSLTTGGILTVKSDTTIGGDLTVSGTTFSASSATASFSQLNVTATTTLATAEGNVGIGLTNPSEKLHVIGDATILDFSNVDPSAGNPAGLTLQANYSSSYRWSIVPRDKGNAIDLEFWGSDTSDIYTKFVSMSPYSGRAQLYVNGNVGIGTTTPAYPLVVNSASANAFIVDSSGDITVSGGDIAGVGSVNLDLGESTADRITWTGSGNFYKSSGSAIYGTINGNVSIDAYYSSQDSNIYLINSHASYVADVDVEGDLTVGGGNINLDDTANVQNSKIDWYATDGDTGQVSYGTSDRWEWTGGSFYITSGVPITYLYSATTYLGAASGANILVRDNELYGDDWIINYNEAGNWGIGDLTPSYNLDVAGTIRATNDVRTTDDVIAGDDVVSLGDRFWGADRTTDNWGVYSETDWNTGTTFCRWTVVCVNPNVSYPSCDAGWTSAGTYYTDTGAPCNTLPLQGMCEATPKYNTYTGCYNFSVGVNDDTWTEHMDEKNISSASSAFLIANVIDCLFLCFGDVIEIIGLDSAIC
ncbi:hypothetical protein LCGC14_2210640, partial [marine sediment metagenome]